MGAILHVTYAPEFETLEETRAKLELRRTELSVKACAVGAAAQAT